MHEVLKSLCVLNIGMKTKQKKAYDFRIKLKRLI